ncbi:MAG TPA: PHB depolymerase family esterase [Thermoanaerobaculia bacterium]|nr:PHB depolymerase family esterase [Thermoanaerobaculia bacterium]
MNRKKRLLAAVLILISLPAAVAAIDAASFYIHNRPNGSIISSDEQRDYLLYVPKSYDPSRPTPLVISMHGAGGWPVQQMELSGWNRLAERHRFIVVYPAGIKRAGPRVWRVGRSPGMMRDVWFIADLIRKVKEDYNIDTQRIYANGISNGAGMSFALSCTLSDRIAAVGLVAGAQNLPWSACTESKAVPMIAFHGTADSMTPYKGGDSWVAPWPFPDVESWVEKWSRRNRCEPRPEESRVAGEVVRREYRNCAENAAVVLYRIDGGGHTWPGGQQLPEWFAGPTSRAIDASALMWEFFEAHPLKGE